MTKVGVFIASIILASAAATIPCQGDEDLDNSALRVFDGKVADVDVGGSTLTVVSGDMRIAFPIAPDTKLTKDGHDIKLSDFGTDDYVTVSYLRSGSESRVPSKVASIALEYDFSQ